MAKFSNRAQPLLEVVMEVGDLPGLSEEHARDVTATFLRSFGESKHRFGLATQVQEIMELAVKYSDSQSLTQGIAEDLTSITITQVSEKVHNYTEAGKFEEAIDYVKQEIIQAVGAMEDHLRQLKNDVSSNYATVLFNRAMDLGNRGTFARAHECLTKALKYESIPEERKIIERALKELNDVAVNQQISRARQKSSDCFVVTATFGTPHHHIVNRFRRFRDERLSKTDIGRMFITIYNRVGPALAWVIRQQPWLRRMLVPLLSCLAKRLPNISQQEMPSTDSSLEECRD